ncbi:hypothetical protein AQJ91_34365 [Streptomyces dysideae]|uniref:Uncharacterized protein n=1 Tax=Streptomyces dysideae TaxID=909626 RepID=A0A101UTY7_9ACTN|nr:hypothetical protein AQJ91_34365 [Streptomyces dysideae]
MTSEDDAPDVEASGSENSPVDLETINDSVEIALAVVLAMPDRSQIDTTTRALIGHLELLLSEDLGYDEDPVVREMYQSAYRLLDLTRRPGAETTHFGAYEYMRDLARLTRRFAGAYRDLNTEEHNDG